MKCRYCGKERLKEILDLGHQPPSNSFLTDKQLDEPEVYYPLKLFVCDSCWLVQIPETKKVADIFTEDYAYYSSESPANVSHAKEYCDMMMDRFGPKKVMEIGSNDGYMLQWFLKKGCSVVGVDPAEGPAVKASSIGIPTFVDFFTEQWASLWCDEIENKSDLICGINVLNHQADINDFVKGLKIALKPGGIITFEFPHLMSMVVRGQWDTIYHEHLNYYSLNVITRIFESAGLYIFDVDVLKEHGGSLRIYASDRQLPFSKEYATVILRETIAGEGELPYYERITSSTGRSIMSLRNLVHDIRSKDGIIIAYGAAAKANTLFNSCRFNERDILAVADRSPYKILKYMPGSHIPIIDPVLIKAYKPDFVMITAWNLKDEIMEQLKYIKDWGGQFLSAEVAEMEK